MWVEIILSLISTLTLSLSKMANIFQKIGGNEPHWWRKIYLANRWDSAKYIFSYTLFVLRNGFMRYFCLGICQIRWKKCQWWIILIIRWNVCWGKLSDFWGIRGRKVWSLVRAADSCPCPGTTCLSLTITSQIKINATVGGYGNESARKSPRNNFVTQRPVFS